MKNLPKLFLSVLGCELIGAAGGLATAPAIPAWYRGLNKPAFAPPNWVFAPAWTLLYLLMGIAFFLIWQKGWKKKKTRVAAAYFFVQLALNFLWSPVFFGLRSPLWGLIVITALWLAIALTMKKFYEVSRTSGFLLVPYLMWVTFAAILNAAIMVLNP